MVKYLKVWLLLCSSSFQSFFVSRIGSVLFLTGKILRFLFFFAFLILIVSRTNALAGYNFWQVMLFYLTFNLVDTITQMLFREVYRFRQYIISGSFDLLLVKPVNVLFRSLFGWTDFLDSINIIPLIFLIIYVGTKISDITFWSVALYFFLVVNSLMIAMSFHIYVLALGILTTEIDHAIMIYRDVTSMGRFPIDIYSEPLRSFITFVLPVGILMSLPAKAMLGVVNFGTIILSVIISLIFFSLSIILWRYSLKKYTSASS